AFRWTMIGWSIPFSFTESASSRSAAGSKCFRGWSGLGSICSIETRSTRAAFSSRRTVRSAWVFGVPRSASLNVSPMRAATLGFLGMVNDLLGQLSVRLGDRGARVVAEDRFRGGDAILRGHRQWDERMEDLPRELRLYGS